MEGVGSETGLSDEAGRGMGERCLLRSGLRANDLRTSRSQGNGNT